MYSPSSMMFAGHLYNRFLCLGPATKGYTIRLEKKSYTYYIRQKKSFVRLSKTSKIRTKSDTQMLMRCVCHV